MAASSTPCHLVQEEMMPLVFINSLTQGVAKPAADMTRSFLILMCFGVKFTHTSLLPTSSTTYHGPRRKRRLGDWE